VGYHYYCGTRVNWRPKINLNSVVYHAVGGQRYAIGGDMYENFHGLVRQYGAMGLKVLGEIHVGPWQKQFFPENYAALRGGGG
jgi:hypothetical protein